MRIQADGFGDSSVASPSESQSFESREESPLSLIEETHEEHDRGLGFIGI